MWVASEVRTSEAEVSLREARRSLVMSFETVAHEDCEEGGQ